MRLRSYSFSFLLCSKGAGGKTEEADAATENIDTAVGPGGLHAGFGR